VGLWSYSTVHGHGLSSGVETGKHKQIVKKQNPISATTNPLTAHAFSDGDLIKRILLKDDHHAFAELVRRHQSALRASWRKMTGGQIEWADDIAQETFILAWKNIKTFRFEAKFSTWLYRVAFIALRLSHCV